MATEQVVKTPVEVDVDNIGGIDSSKVEFSSTVTVLVGRNATNRTSFLQAIMAGLGSEDAALKADAESGAVELSVDGETYRRELVRRNGEVRFDGDPYLENPELADLFAFLLESNEARRAVEQGDDLYDLIMRPVDTAEIDAEIERLESERQEIERELAELEELERRLPGLEEDRTQLESDLEAKRAELEEAKADLAELEADSDRTAVDERFEELRETRRELESVRADIEDQQRIVDALQDDQAELEAQLDGLAEVDDGALSELQSTISQHREAVQSVESTISELQSVIQFNEDMLEASGPDALDGLGADEDGELTDQLVAESEEVTCWTCGSQVERDQIEETVELLRQNHQEKVEQRNELRREIEDLEAERKHIERTKQEQSQLEQDLTEVTGQLETRTEQVEALEEEASDLESEIKELEAAVEELETDDRAERLARHRDVNELEFEVERLESEIEDVRDEIGTIEARVAERDELRAERDAIDEQITELRSRIEQLEAQAVEQFNEQMAQLIERLEFENIERIWIERREIEVTDGRRKETKPVFDLHVVRTGASGSVYEDTVDHLSESEREVVGLVFALSGYLVHEVHKEVPFMLLDSLEALDAQRIGTLIDYLSEQVPNIVVALLPEDAAAVDEEYQRVTEI
jgi:chromosome segregation ATPase